MSREVKERELKYYQTIDSELPYKEWFDSLKSRDTQAEVDARLARVRSGNFGDHKGVGKGVKELRFRSGLRVYFGEDGDTLVLLLTGGDKDSQQNDIELAQDYWKDFKERKNARKKTNKKKK